MLISVVIPCYYSEKTICKVVELVMAEFEKNDGYEEICKHTPPSL